MTNETEIWNGYTPEQPEFYTDQNPLIHARQRARGNRAQYHEPHELTMWLYASGGIPEAEFKLHLKMIADIVHDGPGAYMTPAQLNQLLIASGRDPIPQQLELFS